MGTSRGSCRILAPEDLSIEDGRLMGAGIQIDVVYRRLLTIDIEPRREICEPLIRAARDGLAMVADGFQAWTLSHKGLFGLLHDPETRPADLDDAETGAVEISLPWTRLLDSGDTIGPDDGPRRPLDEIIANYAEVEAALVGTPWEVPERRRVF